MSNIRFVLFDIGNVIIRASHELTFWYLMQQHVVPFESARRFYENPAYADFARGRMTAEDFYQGVINRIGAKLSYNEVKQAHHQQMHTVEVGVIHILQTLKNIGIDIGFATSTNAWQNERELELVDLVGYASTFFRSNELGALKTDPDFFPKVIDSLGINSGRILLIDDGAANLEMARQSGIIGLMYQNPQRLKETLNLYGLLPAKYLF